MSQKLRITTSTTCGRCGNLSTNLVPAPQRSRSQLRSRLADLDELIATPTAERRRIQVEMDSIVYLVLTLPAEITMEIFRRTLPVIPRPSPRESPLLLIQICQLWRDFVLNAPLLWQFFTWKKNGAVELLQLWLSRSRNAEMHYSLLDHSVDPTVADALMDTVLNNSHHWEDVALGLPFSSFPRLNLRAFPLLRKIYLQTIQPGAPDVVLDRIAIWNAPLLHSVRIATPHIDFDLRFPQLTSLTLDSNMPFVECMALLSLCPQIVDLDVSILNIESATPPSTIALTLYFLESLSILISPQTFDLLSSTEILPGLKPMKLRGGRTSAHEYVALPNMLRARREVSDSRPVTLTYFDASLVTPTSPMVSWNSAAVIAVFKALADGGLRMHVELITRGPRSSTTAVIESQGNGLTWG
ncbi:hypothetical protein C8J57DRAFT_1325281 [Mycena rebaudengoi]|nr:hypothetical protein C8J57DRAFT_1325281 [Mycena rebaudengoi]